MNRRLVVIRFVTDLSPAISLGRKSSGRWHRHKFIDSPCAKGEINLISIRAWQTFLTDCSSSGLLYNAREEMFSLVQLLGYLTLSPCKHPQIEAVWKRFIELSTVSVEMALRVSISNLLETPRDKNAAVEFNEPILFCYLQLLVYYISTFICASWIDFSLFFPLFFADSGRTFRSVQHLALHVAYIYIFCCWNFLLKYLLRRISTVSLSTFLVFHIPRTEVEPVTVFSFQTQNAPLWYFFIFKVKCIAFYAMAG